MEIINQKDKNIFLKILKLILIFGSFFLIIKLFFFGWNLIQSGWFIRIWYSFEFDWTYASTIALLLLWLWIYIVIFYHERNRLFAIIFIFVLSLLWKQMFYFVDSDFDFYYNTPKVSYMDENRLLTDFDEFVRLYDKHCSEIEWWSFKNNSRAWLCGWLYKYPKDFWTVEDYKKALDYFNKTNNSNLYSWAYNLSIRKFWLETMIESYRDDTFYWRVIYSMNIDQENINLIISITKDLDFIEIIKYYESMIVSWNIVDLESWTYFRSILFKKLNSIKTINVNVIY